MKSRLVAAALGALLMSSAGTACAHGGDDDREGDRPRYEIAEAEAIEVAVAEGLAEVWEVKARRGVWEIEGADQDGRKIEVEIDGDTGEVVKVERY